MRQQAWYHKDKTPEANWAWFTADAGRKQRNAKVHHEKDVRKAKKASAKDLEKLKKGMEEQFKRELEGMKKELELETEKKEKKAAKEELEAFKQQTAEEKKQQAAERREREREEREAERERAREERSRRDSEMLLRQLQLQQQSMAANREGQFGAAQWPTMQESHQIEGPGPLRMIESAPTEQGSMALAMRSREQYLEMEQQHQRQQQQQQQEQQQQQSGHPGNVFNLNMLPPMSFPVNYAAQEGFFATQPQPPVTQRPIGYIEMDTTPDDESTEFDGVD
ncbi:MAG: hypothetical protein Q9210_006986 [Variospora velana]